MGFEPCKHKRTELVLLIAQFSNPNANANDGANPKPTPLTLTITLTLTLTSLPECESRYGTRFSKTSKSESFGL